ncbi:ribonuclease HI [Arthrobacter sp. BE255]|nr:ribonuclease HI [Arthrobacter sp. BE255]
MAGGSKTAEVAEYSSRRLSKARRLRKGYRHSHSNGVRGHDGHPLNEIADLARRNREKGIDDVIGHRMVAGVREDAKIICATI